jgi:uncharacterized protein (UPF0335 family)
MGKIDPETSITFATEGSGATTSISAEQLLQHVDRIRKLNADRKALSDDVADEYNLAKASGFDKAVLKVLVKRLDSDPDELENLDNLLHLYERTYRQTHGAGAVG